MNVIEIDIQDEEELEVLSHKEGNVAHSHVKLSGKKHVKVSADRNKEGQASDRNEQSLSQKSSQHEDYVPESQSSENTIKYKRYSLRIRDIKIICPDQFYKKGQYSGIHQIKMDTHYKHVQKKEERLKNSPKTPTHAFRYKKQECLSSKMKGRKLQSHNYSIQRRKFIFKSDRIIASNLFASKKLQGK